MLWHAAANGQGNASVTLCIRYSEYIPASLPLDSVGCATAQAYAPYAPTCDQITSEPAPYAPRPHTHTPVCSIQGRLRCPKAVSPGCSCLPTGGCSQPPQAISMIIHKQWQHAIIATVRQTICITAFSAGLLNQQKHALSCHDMFQQYLYSATGTCSVFQVSSYASRTLPACTY